MHDQPSEVLLAERLTTDIHRLTLRAPQIALTAAPGQFVMLRVSPAGLDPLLRRPFSIHQIFGDGRVQILYKVVGKGTSLMARLASGDRVHLLGPLGRGFTLPVPEEDICLIGGGMGAAPLLFLARTLAGKVAPEQGRILLGARNREELEAITDVADTGFPLATATDDGSAGHHGFVIDLLDSLPPRERGYRVYSCGPYPMLRAVAQLCHLKGWPCQVSLETHMACGVGVCLGCALPRRGLDGYLHVCKDGPVFEAGQVAWF